MLLYLADDSQADALHASNILGAACFGEHDGALPPWPQQCVTAAVNAPAVEYWCANTQLTTGERDGIVWRRSGEFLFGVLTLDEAQFTHGHIPAPQAAALEAYGRIFSLLAEQGVPHLWRAWNYLAHINAVVDGVERYRLFNTGRQQAFAAAQRHFTGSVPAASALGLATGVSLRIAFLATTTPAQAIENPRQVSAWRYPPQYGSHSPTFSRAVLACQPQQDILLISGTASIVGHASLHAGDVLAQCHETFANLNAVLAEANRHCRSVFTLDNLRYRIYLRSLNNLPQLQTVLAEYCQSAPRVCVEADICRTDLEIEIEASGIQNRSL